MKTLILLAVLAVSASAESLDVVWQYWRSPCTLLAAQIPACANATAVEPTVMVHVRSIADDVVNYTITVDYTEGNGTRKTATKTFERKENTAWTQCQFLDLVNVKVRRVSVTATSIRTIDAE